MILDYVDGRDQLFTQYATVLPGCAAIIGAPFAVVWQGVELDQKIPTSGFWARASIQTVDEEQSTLAGSVEGRRFTTDGLIFIQLFGPKDKPENYEKLLKVAALTKTAFRGKHTPDGCIWFRNTRQQELPDEEAWKRINVVSEYHYDEIG